MASEEGHETAWGAGDLQGLKSLGLLSGGGCRLRVLQWLKAAKRADHAVSASQAGSPGVRAEFTPAREGGHHDLAKKAKDEDKAKDDGDKDDDDNDDD